MNLSSTNQKDPYIYKFKRRDGSIVEAMGDSAKQHFAKLQKYGWKYVGKYIAKITGTERVVFTEEGTGKTAVSNKITSMQETHPSKEPPEINFKKNKVRLVEEFEFR